jgi:hypothetical protein
MTASLYFAGLQNIHKHKCFNIERMQILQRCILYILINNLLRALKQQNSIGWDQWFKGRRAITWGEMYNHDIKQITLISTQTRGKFSADKWGITILNITWQYIIESWLIRNNIEHKSTKNKINRQK